LRQIQYSDYHDLKKNASKNSENRIFINKVIVTTLFFTDYNVFQGILKQADSGFSKKADTFQSVI